jgi:hypothetical protein
MASGLKRESPEARIITVAALLFLACTHKEAPSKPNPDGWPPTVDKDGNMTLVCHHQAQGTCMQMTVRSEDYLQFKEFCQRQKDSRPYPNCPEGAVGHCTFLPNGPKSGAAGKEWTLYYYRETRPGEGDIASACAQMSSVPFP